MPSKMLESEDVHVIALTIYFLCAILLIRLSQFEISSSQEQQPGSKRRKVSIVSKPVALTAA